MPGVGPVIDVVQGFVHAVVGDNRQQWAEYFFPKNPHVVGSVQDQVRRHPAGVLAEILVPRVYLDHFRPFVPGIAEDFLQTPMLAIINDGGVVRVVLDRRVHGRKGGAELVHEAPDPIRGHRM